MLIPPPPPPQTPQEIADEFSKIVIGKFLILIFQDNKRRVGHGDIYWFTDKKQLRLTKEIYNVTINSKGKKRVSLFHFAAVGNDVILTIGVDEYIVTSKPWEKEYGRIMIKVKTKEELLLFRS
jgi:hypothetical protein